MKPLAIVLAVACCLALRWSAAAEPIAIDERAATEFFEKKIRPLLVQRCYECHSQDKAGESGQLAVDSRAALLKGGDRGAVLVAGQPEESLLLKAIKYGDPKLQMPPEGKLPEAEIELLTKWLADGAFVPEYGVAVQPKGKEIDWTKARQFWSVKPLERVTIPDAPKSAIANPIDSFIAVKLAENGLTPSPSADKRTLIRRLAFDLIGLPPSPAEVAEFLADERPDAYEQLVDRLLASPHFGERWARYWLDMARYVDFAPDWQKNADNAWLYRDWIMRAFNEDRPYDEFVTLQLAADLSDDADPRDIAALGLLGVSPTYWKELRLAPSVIEVIVADEWDERLDTVTRTFLGLTVACARCHDHKFDPITARDYTALAGIFASIDLADRPLLPIKQSEQVRAARTTAATLNEQLKKVTDKASDEAKQFQQQLIDLRTATPHFDAVMAPVIAEASVFVMPDGPDATKLDIRQRQPRDLPLFRRGNPNNPGEIVPRGFLELFASREIPSALTPTRSPRDSGRGELARAILSDARSLTARVITNRVWSHHFGRGLVRTPGDFGQQGERPSHPELLDWLSGELLSEAGLRAGIAATPPSMARAYGTGLPAETLRSWSLKRLHRLLVTSSTYRQQSSSATQSIDPDNHLLGRANRRRLEIEPWRDAMLTVAGMLDDSLGGKSLDLSSPMHHRRTLYGQVGRDEQHDILRLFDFPPPTNHSPARDVTTTPLQQLFVLNSPFVDAQSAAIVATLQDSSTSERIARVYARLYQREPTANEQRVGEAFLNPPTPDRWRSYVKSLIGLNEFLFVD